ncbi:hypothetical protein Tco_1335448 [Tanacetum coccineum]
MSKQKSIPCWLFKSNRTFLIFNKNHFMLSKCRFTELEQAVKELKQADHSIAILASIKSQVPSVVEDYIGLSLLDALKKCKKTKKRRFNESKSSKKTSTTKESSKGKSLARTSKSRKSVTAKESVEEPVFEIASDDVEQTFDDKVGYASQPPHTNVDEIQADVAPRILKKDWFKESPKLELLDPNWNTVKTMDDVLEQSWFNVTIQAEKHSHTFDELMSTPIHFSTFSMNNLKLNKITRADLVGPMFNLLKGHKSLVDISKPLPLQDKQGRLINPVEFFFNNDLEYLKAVYKERTYSSLITKTPATRYTMKGIEDMIPTLWSPVLIANDKDLSLGISH